MIPASAGALLVIVGLALIYWALVGLGVFQETGGGS